MPRSRNSSTSESSGFPIKVDEPLTVPDAQNLTQTMQENTVANLAPSDVNSRPVDFEFITNNTITLHESPISSDANALFNSPNLGPTNSPGF